MEYVIGSGPAGMACAAALLARGRDVTMLDAGLTLEAGREALRTAMAAQAPADWTDEQHAMRKMKLGQQMPEFKLTHGSDYPYRAAPDAPGLEIEVPGVAASYALGGLSNVWGAAMLPYRAADIEGWPVGIDTMAQAYRHVLSLVPMAGQADALEAAWPFHVRPRADVPVSRQADVLLRRLEWLKLPGVTAGRARLAVRAPLCIACGECLNGCPRELIFSARHRLATLCGAGMNYVPNVVVRGVQENGQGVVLHATTPEGWQRFSGERVFVAAGVYGSTGLMLRSLGLGHTEILDSQYFTLPLLGLGRQKGVMDEALHTLAQVFVEIEDAAVNARNVHLQLYGYSDVLEAMIAQKLGPLKGLRRLVLERALIVQGYLHSDSSGRLEAKLDGDVMRVTPHRNPATRAALKRVVKKIRQMKLGARPLGMLLQETLPGRGYHSGGSFPMRLNPGAGETDYLGRPFGRSRTHIVDASVFPTIPAATITLSVMANAWRIGFES
ncbi:MAG TPA: GMC oxidoreductase [Acidocella sp.]|jgi:choline dehydrogenase-like flavoprotein|nr:GMC oxidoreductase [Acidocella sp.]